ncbi:MAG: presenilin family intramembrane aspartyl protease [Nanoarchaeota archaeon]
MKHSIKITILLLSMFFIAQLIGLGVISIYSPHVTQITDENGNIVNFTSYNIPYGMEPPQGLDPSVNLISIVIAIIIAISAMFVLMKFGATILLRLWFFIVIVLALGLAINALLLGVNYSPWIALAIALPLAFIKVFKRNIFVHNTTELLIYPGIAAIFVPLLNIWTVCALLVLISLYDMYVVWKAGFMQKMAKYQIKTLRIFSGFFIPYLGNKESELIKEARRSNSKKLRNKKMKVNVAILGGGDVVFPIILAGVVLRTLGFLPALIISIGATLALAYLFYVSEKGKFYPAMPFITFGCFIALIFAYLI